MKTELLSLLRRAGGYVSGQQLCEQLHVSRTAVWKVMEQLKEEGYQIEAVRNKGYCLKGSPDILSEAEIASRISGRWAGGEVCYFQETDSTNTQAKALAEKGAPHGTIVAADCQLAGKGRRGRVWESPSGRDIYVTLLLRPQIAPVKAPMLTLVMAMAVAEAVREYTGLEAGIKWPNDIVVSGKKVCGILTEMSVEADYISYVVIGTGINVNQPSFPEELAERASSLYLETGRQWKRAPLLALVLEKFEQYYALFSASEDLSGIQEAYNRILVNAGREVRIMEPEGEYTAFARGINEKGELLVQKDGGQEEAVYAGEVSVRGIYGYV